MDAAALVYFGAALIAFCAIGALIEWCSYENRKSRRDARAMRRRMQ